MSLTSKQEAFCLHYVQSHNASAAYRACYNAVKMNPSSIRKAAMEVIRRPAVAARVAALQAEMAYKHAVTRESLMHELEEARQLAMRKENPTAMSAATMGKAKLAGFLDGRRDDEEAPIPSSVEVKVIAARKGKQDADAE